MVNCSFRSLRRGSGTGTAGQTHDDSVWPNNRAIGRWANAQQRCKRRYRYRTDLPLRRDAGRRRYGCGCPSDSRKRGNEIMLQFSANGHHIGSASSARHPGVNRRIDAQTRDNETANSLGRCDHYPLLDPFNYTEFRRRNNAAENEAGTSREIMRHDATLMRRMREREKEIAGESFL